MATFELQISGDLSELQGIAAALGASPAGPAPVDAAGLSAADKPTRATRTKSDKGSTTDATAASPATEPVTPLTQQTAEQTKAVDPAVLAAQNGGTETTAQPEKAEEVAPTPSAGAPGEVTYDMLKDAMTAVLSKGSAKQAQDIVREHGSGAANLSGLAKTDYAAVHAALVAAVA